MSLLFYQLFSAGHLFICRLSRALSAPIFLILIEETGNM